MDNKNKISNNFFSSENIKDIAKELDLDIKNTDDRYTDSRLSVYMAACITYGYDKNISSCPSLPLNIFKKFYNVIFGREYSLLKLKNKKETIIGIRSIKLDSILNSVDKMDYLQKLFQNIKKEDICYYAFEFLKKAKLLFEKNDEMSKKLIKIACNKIFALVEHPKKKDGPDIDAEDIKKIKNHPYNQNPLEKNIHGTYLTEVNMKNILSCSKLYVQNTYLKGREYEPLSNEFLEKLKYLANLYTGHHHLIMNALLRGKLISQSETNLHKKIDCYKKKLNKVMKTYKIYQADSNEQNFIVSADIYDSLKNDCDELKDFLKTAEFCGTFWRIMDTVGLKAMLQDEEIYTLMETDDKIKRNLKDLKDERRSYYLNILNNHLKNKIIIDRAFLSTSLSDEIVFSGFGTRSIVLKITGKFKGILVGSFSEYPSEKEFLMPPKTKLKIVSVTNYDGNANPARIKNECIQLNCVPG